MILSSIGFHTNWNNWATNRNDWLTVMLIKLLVCPGLLSLIVLAAVDIAAFSFLSMAHYHLASSLQWLHFGAKPVQLIAWCSGALPGVPSLPCLLSLSCSLADLIGCLVTITGRTYRGAPSKPFYKLTWSSLPAVGIEITRAIWQHRLISIGYIFLLTTLLLANDCT